MILKQVFKTAEGARKRAALENARCNGKYIFTPVRFFNDLRDIDLFVDYRWSKYTWRLKRKTKKST